MFDLPNGEELVSDDEIRGAIDRLAARVAVMPVGQFKLYQQAVGFNNERYGILRDVPRRPVVKPASQYCHDWMHAIMVSGVMNVVIYLLLAAIMASGMNDVYGALYSYCGNWSWPKIRNHGTSVRGLFLQN